MEFSREGGFRDENRKKGTQHHCIAVAADYLQKKGISTSGYDASAYKIYNGYRVYFAPPSPLGYARSGGDIQVIVGIDGAIVQVLRGQ